MWNESEYLSDDSNSEFDSEVDDNNDDNLFSTCPHCHASIYEDSVQCIECGNYIIESSSAWQGKSLLTKWLFVFIVFVLILLMFLLSVIGG